jgi:hypothetical protein
MCDYFRSHIDKDIKIVRSLLEVFSNINISKVNYYLTLEIYSDLKYIEDLAQESIYPDAKSINTNILDRYWA